VKTGVVAGLYAEVPADAAPLSTRRLATRALRRSPDGNGIRLRWFRSVVGNDLGPLRRAFRSLMAEDGLAFVASDRLAGRVLLTEPLTVWLNADLPIDAVAAVVAHEVEHTRTLALCGPPGSDAERDAHELAADLAADSVICQEHPK
jgi:hypothetical protein